ncbi:MAG: pyroglutamyl-peptidase I [Xanthomonadales bacterium]|nr:pyroglutamyl-peptidase I [Xanthomonadales bacterium]
MPVILLTGFEPFGGERVNPSQEIVRVLDGEVVAGHRIVGAVLPVVFEGTPERLRELIGQHRPAIALGLGQAGGRSALSLERVAVNLVDARIADNAGAQPFDCPVIAGAAPAHFTTLPTKAMVAAITECGIPAELSLSAGSFVCNQVFYALAQLATEFDGLRAGFMHLPWLPAQAARFTDQPSMALAIMLEGVRAALACAIATRHDPVVAGGATH